ncbi:MAG TPA: hypothetical protein VGI74_05000 [Streptosporangiaceae bacterium]|jgi:hypothetical protein
MMRLHSNASKRPRLLAGGIALTAALAACSSGGSTPKASTPPVTAPSSTPAASAPAAPTTSAAADAASGMSGTWSGQYGGAFTGTFKLTWQQKGSSLSGSITLSTAGTSAIHGQVSGSAISFGTVGGQDITYKGTVSGSSMSGSYQVHAPSGAVSGTWSASKSG